MFALRRDDVGLQVAHMRAALAAAMYSAMSCAPPSARSRTKPGAARLSALGGALRPPPLHTQLQGVKKYLGFARETFDSTPKAR